MSGVDLVRCRVCGCTDEEPCEGGCWWVPDPEQLGDLCSVCRLELGISFTVLLPDGTEVDTDTPGVIPEATWTDERDWLDDVEGV